MIISGCKRGLIKEVCSDRHEAFPPRILCLTDASAGTMGHIPTWTSKISFWTKDEYEKSMIYLFKDR